MKKFIKMLNNFKNMSCFEFVGAIGSVIFSVLAFVAYEKSDAFSGQMLLQFIGMIFFVINIAIIIISIVVGYLAFPYLSPKDKLYPKKKNGAFHIVIAILETFMLGLVGFEIVTNPETKMFLWLIASTFGVLALAYNLMVGIMFFKCHFYMPPLKSGAKEKLSMKVEKFVGFSVQAIVGVFLNLFACVYAVVVANNVYGFTYSETGKNLFYILLIVMAVLMLLILALAIGYIAKGNRDKSHPARSLWNILLSVAGAPIATIAFTQAFSNSEKLLGEWLIVATLFAISIIYNLLFIYVWAKMVASKKAPRRVKYDAPATDFAAYDNTSFEEKEAQEALASKAKKAPVAKANDGVIIDDGRVEEYETKELSRRELKKALKEERKALLAQEKADKKAEKVALKEAKKDGVLASEPIEEILPQEIRPVDLDEVNKEEEPAPLSRKETRERIKQERAEINRANREYYKEELAKIDAALPGETKPATELEIREYIRNELIRQGNEPIYDLDQWVKDHVEAIKNGSRKVQ